jgi:hypothetical protein
LEPVVPWLSSVIALIGVVVGAASSYLVSHFTERTRWSREQAARWDQARFETFMGFLSTAKTISMLASRIVVNRGLRTEVLPVDVEEGLARLAEEERERSIRFEGILLLANSSAIGAAQQINEALWRLESIARGDTTVDTDGWWSAFREYRRTRAEFYVHARDNLKVPTAETPLTSWKVPGQPDRSDGPESLPESADRSG